jgi:hypothetical protein
VGVDRRAPGRGAPVPHAPCATVHTDLGDVGVVGDRSSASPCLATDGDARLWALWWAQVRRDVLTAARRGPALARGMCPWVDAIRARSPLHAARLAVWEETWRLEPHPAACVERHRDLETPRRQRQERCEAPRHEPDLPVVTPKVLSRLQTHWDGRTVVVERPAVARDTQSAERRRRTPGVGRTHADGSGSVWSAHLAARMCRVRHPVVLWGLTPPHGLRACGHAGAEHGGTSPTDRSAVWPWQLAPARRAALARPVPGTVPPVAGLCHEREEPEAADTSSSPIHLVTRSTRRPMAPGETPMPPHGGAQHAATRQRQRPHQVTAALCPITPGAMRTRGRAAGFLGWVSRIFT